jgi:hypothetical protein
VLTVLGALNEIVIGRRIDGHQPALATDAAMHGFQELLGFIQRHLGARRPVAQHQ